MMKCDSSAVFEGKPILKGVACGPLYFYEEESVFSGEDFSATLDAEKEIEKYHRAILITKKELGILLKRLKDLKDQESVAIFEAHLMILEDPFFAQQVETDIHQHKLSALNSLKKNLDLIVTALEASEDPFFKDRIVDMKDLAMRIALHLHGMEPKIPVEFHGAIVCMKEVTPSMAAQAALKGVRGFITLKGSSASHTSVVLKSRAIPHVILDKISFLAAFQTKEVLLDGKKGVIFVEPSADLKSSYQQQDPQACPVLASKNWVDTLDGKSISVFSTFDGVEYSKELKNGIGLYRTEFILLHDREVAFCEERQVLLYQSIIEDVQPHKVVFRLFDLGGDKNFLHDYSEKTKHLRSIRYLFARSEILELQIRSLIKASMGKTLEILIPYVTSAEEVHVVRQEIDSVLQSFESDCVVRLGAMIETPLTSSLLDQILEQVDFIAIGTNDLTQSLIEIHRDSPDFCSYQPDLFKTINRVIEGANKWEKPVSVCGEIVSNPIFTELLIGLGATDFSCSFHEIPQVKKRIATVSLNEAKGLVNAVFRAKNSEEVKNLLSKNFYSTVA